MLTAIENWQTTDAPRALRVGEVHLWRARLHPTVALSDTLSRDEWIRAGRFHFQRERDRHVATRGLLRTILAGYLDVSPQEIEFSVGPHGKPALKKPDSMLRFNVSHSEDLMLLAVTYGREIGIDLEQIQQNLPFETLADYYFDPEEAWELRQLPEEKRAWKFYDVWTCTEAQLKASGTGFAEGGRVLDPDRWSLLKLAPAEGFAAAVAIEGSDFQIECCSWPS